MIFTKKGKWFVPGIAGLTTLALIVGATLALREVYQILQAAEPQTPALFDHGLTALDPKAPQGWTNQWCGSCHKQEYEQWSSSRHAVSGSTHNFEVEFREPGGGRQQHCLNCHAPTSPGRGLLPTHEPRAIDAAFASKSHPAWLSGGVDCLTCHVRDGKVLVTRTSTEAEQAHATRVAPELATAEFCAGCHQFSFKSHVAPDGYFGQLQQASFEEFLDFRAEGGTETRCHDCHMPDGHHGMPGGYDDDMLLQAVSLDLAVRSLDDSNTVEVAVDVIAGHVGHRIPGGEHFRFLTLHTELVDADGAPIRGTNEADQPNSGRSGPKGDKKKKVVTAWPQVETFRRQMGPFEQGSGQEDAQPLPDTRLWPGEVRRFRYRMRIDADGVKTPLRAQSRIWYHLMHESKAKDFGHDLHKMKRVVLSEEATLELKRKRDR